MPWIFYSLVLPVLACKSHGQLHGRLINNYFLIFYIIQCNPNKKQLGGESPTFGYCDEMHVSLPADLDLAGFIWFLAK